MTSEQPLDFFDESAAAPRFAHRGRTFVYVLPCQTDDILKVGFSSNPLTRLRTLYPRYFEFFDLDRSVLIETDHLRDARRIERTFITTFVDYQAPSPLLVRREAAGHTEWYRGAYPLVLQLACAIAEQEALVLHQPLRYWLRTRYLERADMLYDWSAKAFETIEFSRHNAAPEVTAYYEKALRDNLDAFASVDIALDEHVPAHVLAWYLPSDAC